MENKYLKETAMNLCPGGDTENTTIDTGGTDDPKTGGGGGNTGGD